MAAGFTVVEYNGITIYNCHTTQFNEKDVYDESETDLLYHEYEITVEGYLYPHGDFINASSKIEPSTGGFGASAAQHHVDVRALLLQPRKEFTMTLGAQVNGSGFSGGTVLLHAVGRDQHVVDTLDTLEFDMNNGPKPQSVKISRIAADEVIKIEYTIKIAREQCQGTGEVNTTGVQSNRWTVTDEIDKNLYTTRTWAGVLEARNRRTVPNINVFRRWCIPKLAPGMRREKTSFEVDATGLKLRYSITDKEILAAAPSPATDWKISHNESITENGAAAEARCVVEMVGPSPGHSEANATMKTTHRKVMLANALSAVVGILVGMNRFKRAEGFIIRSLEFDCGYGSESENRVSVSMHVTKQAVELRDDFTTTRLGRVLNSDDIAGYNPTLTNPDLTNPKKQPTQSLDRFRGEIPLDIALSAHLQESCNDNHKYSDSGDRGPRDSEMR